MAKPTIKPASRPKITLEEVKKRIASFKVDECVYIVAIRGYYEDTMGEKGKNDRGIYDDAMILVAPGYYKTFNGNTDPSIYKEGIGTLIPGLHYYKKGKHGISGDHPYDAFRPDTPDESLPVTRDGQKGIKKGIAVNLHKGSFTKTSSLACQTVYPDQWDEFQEEAYSLMSEYHQKRIPYILTLND